MTATTQPRPHDVSDEDLMKRIQADDIGAFETLFDRYSAQAFGLARAMCRSHDDAEEAVQDGFLAVWSSRGGFDPTRGTARAWLFTVIRHRTLDLMRRGRCGDRLRDCDDQLAHLPAPGSIAERAEQRDDIHELRVSLLKLPPAQREVIALAYFGGLTHTEIAARLHVPAGTVKGRMRLGLHKVRAGTSSLRSPDAGQTQPSASELSVVRTP